MSKSQQNLKSKSEEHKTSNPFSSSNSEILDRPRITKHGLTTAGLDEQPIDMLGVFLHEKRIQELDKTHHGSSGELHFFIADRFEALNMSKEDAKEFLESENESRTPRESYLSAASDLVGIEDVGFVRSEDVFSDSEFYEIAEDILAGTVETSSSTSFDVGYSSLVSAKRDVESVMPKSIIDRGISGKDALELFGSVHSVEIPETLHNAAIEFENQTGEEMKAAHWYGVFEIAATEWMARKQGINNKSGHDKENIYDKKIEEFLNTSRYNQPVSLGSQMKNAGTRIPYTVWPNREDSRILLSDSESEIEEKLDSSPTNYVVTTTGDVPGYVWNPVVEKGIMAAEVMSEFGEGLETKQNVLTSAEEVIDYILDAEMDSYSINDVASVTLESTYSNSGIESDKIDQNRIEEIKKALPEAYDKVNTEIKEMMA